MHHRQCATNSPPILNLIDSFNILLNLIYNCSTLYNFIAIPTVHYIYLCVNGTQQFGLLEPYYLILGILTHNHIFHYYTKYIHILWHSTRPCTNVNQPNLSHLSPPRAHNTTKRPTKRMHRTWLNFRALLLNLGQVQHAITIRYRAFRSTTCINFARCLGSMVNARRRTLTGGFQYRSGTCVTNPMESLANLPIPPSV